jgi:hypothetical protein
MADDPDALADELLERTVALTVELHPAIEHLMQPGHYPPNGMPAAALFEHPEGAEVPRHRAGHPSPAVAELATDAAAAAQEQLGYGRRDGNPLLPALALAAFYLVEARRVDLLGLRDAASGRIVVGVVEPELADHEPLMAVGGRLLRTWFPVAGAPVACVQVRFGRP